jgi:hypothetical protein
MAYVKSAAIGLIAAVACIAQFTGVLGIFRYDARYLMGKFWFISLLVLLVVFATGSYLSIRKASGPKPSQ